MVETTELVISAPMRVDGFPGEMSLWTWGRWILRYQGMVGRRGVENVV